MTPTPRPRALATTLLALALLAQTLPARQTKPQQQPRTPAPPRTDETKPKPAARPSATAATTAPAAAATPDPADAMTLDELFAADAYALYGEMRMTGQHFSSEEFKQMLEPLRLTGALPPDLFELFNFIAANSEQLTSARVAFGAMPARAGLPSVLAAVELPSADEARKFAPHLRDFLAKSNTWGGGASYETETAAATASTPADAGRRARRGRRRAAAAATKIAAAKEATLPYHIRRAGQIVALADATFTFEKVRGNRDAPALAQEPGFAAARSRLATETVFLYVNTTRMGASTRRQMEEFERQQQVAEEQARLELERESRAGGRANSATNRNSSGGGGRGGRRTELTIQPGEGPSVVVTNSVNTNTNANTNAAVAPDPAGGEELAARLGEVEAGLAAHEEGLKKQTPEEQAKRREDEARRAFENQLGRMIFSDIAPFSPVAGAGGGGAWPESVGVGLAFEGDSVVVRAFFVSESEDRPARPVPFMPILHAGPQVAPEAANVLPADTDILVSASLDLTQMYDYVSSMFRIFDLAAAAAGEGDKQGLFDSQVGAFERQHKFRIKEDLINALGNEFAVALPSEFLGVRRKRATAKEGAKESQAGSEISAAESQAAGSVVVVISLRDKRAMQQLLPRALAAVGIPGLSEQQLLQKDGDAELVTFAGGSVAFIDRFLVITFEPRTMRQVVDAYNDGRTLGQSRAYREPADWQPRQLIGQAYVSSALLAGMFGDVHASLADIDDEALRGYLSRLDAEPGAITLAASKDAGGLTHELHVPKNLLTLWAASSLVSQKLAGMRANESHAVFTMYSITQMQREYKKAHGRYASLDELRRETEKGGAKDFTAAVEFDLEGYEIKLTAAGDTFEATATPTGYPKQGRRSFHIDQTGTLRGGDLNGRLATAASDPVSY